MQVSSLQYPKWPYTFNDNRTQARSFNLVYFLEWSGWKVFILCANAGLSPNLHGEILCWKAC